MQKILFLFLFVAFLTPLANAQIQPLKAKWTTEGKVVLDSLPTLNQAVYVPLRADIKSSVAELKATCGKIPTQTSTWGVAAEGKGFIISLNRELYPGWTHQEWENHINRMMNAYFPKQ